jgi:hypothetical protein
VRLRRDDDAWPEWIYQTQLKRLASARENADIVVATDDLGLNEVIEKIIDLLGQLSNEQR